jgi:hypothetical protein
MRKAIVVTAGLCLTAIGVLHDAIGLGGLRRAALRGDVAERLVGQLMINWLFSGAAMSVLGMVVVLAAVDLETAGPLARRVIVMTGVFFVAVGLLSYAAHPRPAVLGFAVLGLMTCGPVLGRSPTSRS